MTKSKGERRPGTVQWNNAQRTMEKKDGLSILQERVAGDSRPAATKSGNSGKKRAKIGTLFHCTRPSIPFYAAASAQANPLRG